MRPCSSTSSSRSSTPERSSSSLSDAACSERRRLPRSSSWLSSISARIVSIGSAGWLMTLRIIAWLTRIREDERLGRGVAELVVGLLGPADVPLRRSLLLQLLELLRVVAGLLRGALVLDHVIGRLHDDVAARVEAGAPGAAGDLVELARLQQPVAGPSYFARPVKTTVRIGTLMPTPSVSVPQIAFSSPVCASCSTSRR